MYTRMVFGVCAYFALHSLWPYNPAGGGAGLWEEEEFLPRSTRSFTEEWKLWSTGF